MCYLLVKHAFISAIFFYHYTGMVVSRVRLNRLDSHAYAQCFRATFDQVTEDHPTFQPGNTLTGIIADWSDQQITGLEMVLGKPTAGNILKGCQVHIMMHLTCF